MRILYGVVGEGMGHATRSRVVIEHLLRRGHTIRIVVSGRAHAFLRDAFASNPSVEVEEIQGLTLELEDNELRLLRSVAHNLARAPAGLWRNLRAYTEMLVEGFRPDAVVSDFESWAYTYGLFHGIPVISIDNQQVIARCDHEIDVTDLDSADFRLVRAAVKLKLPGAYHYLVTSFFFPPIRKPRTALVPPILRPEVLAAHRRPGGHLVFYQSGGTPDSTYEALRSVPCEVRIYGKGRDERDGNLWFRPFSNEGFIADLATARAVVAGAGFSLMSEAVHLQVPMLCIPIEGQFEQTLNARYLEKLGYGLSTPDVTREAVLGFLERTPEFQAALNTYVPRDNSMLEGCLDELLSHIAAGLRSPDVLASPHLGHPSPPPAPAEPTDGWRPEIYNRFRDERSAPFEELVSMLRPVREPLVVDLGCGTGELTARLHRAVGASMTVGIDSSDAMLAERARFTGPGLSFSRGDLRDVDALRRAVGAVPGSAPFDIVFSSSALQWVDDHEGLLASLTSLVRARGQLVFQVPSNHEHATARIASELAAESPYAVELAGYVRPSPVLDIEAYALLLQRLGYTEQRVMERVYLLMLDDPDAVVDWCRGSLLSPYRARLSPGAWTSFESEYRRRVVALLGDEAPYPFTYRRTLVWAQR